MTASKTAFSCCPSVTVTTSHWPVSEKSGRFVTLHTVVWKQRTNTCFLSVSWEPHVMMGTVWHPCLSLQAGWVSLTSGVLSPLVYLLPGEVRELGQSLGSGHTDSFSEHLNAFTGRKKHSVFIPGDREMNYKSRCVGTIEENEFWPVIISVVQTSSRLFPMGFMNKIHFFFRIPFKKIPNFILQDNSDLEEEAGNSEF